MGLRKATSSGIALILLPRFAVNSHGRLELPMYSADQDLLGQCFKTPEFRQPCQSRLLTGCRKMVYFKLEIVLPDKRLCFKSRIVG